MESNFWEEQVMEDSLLKTHTEKVDKMHLPNWIKEIKCPFCNKNVESRAFRNIQLCLNTRNFGEIAIQVFCDDCKKMDTLYFRTKVGSINDFIGYLKDFSEKSLKPILEEDMYRMNYNNILEIMSNNEEERNDDV